MAKKMDKYNLRNKSKQLSKKAAPPPSDSEEDEEEYYETCSDSDEEEEEDSDSTYEPPKKKKSKRVIESDSEEEEDDDEYESDINQAEFQKMLSKMFPSKYMKEKAKKSEKKSEKSKSKKSSPKSKKSKKSNSKSKKQESESEEESESEDDIFADDEDDDYDDDDDEMESEEILSPNGSQKFNIIFTIGDGENGGYLENDLELADTSNDDPDEYNSEDEKTFMKETYTQPPKDVIERENLMIETHDVNNGKKKETGKKGKKDSSKDKQSKDKKAEPKEVTAEEVDDEYKDLVELRKHLMEKLLKRPQNKILKHAIKECEESIRDLVKKTRSQNTKTYFKLINGGDENRTNEIDYFKKKLSNKEQMKIMADLKEINKHMHVEKPYRLALLESNIPAKYKANVLQKLNTLRSMEPGDPEYYKIKTWIDTFMRVPFGVYKNLTVKMTDGVDACHDYMLNAKKILDDCVYGLNDAKLQILQMVGQWVANPSAMGTAIAIKGPMGTGKTTLVKDGISKILGREFAFITLGGAGDSSFLEGHSYTYEGSSWGKIVQILIDSKCMNPVIYFDELDKISDTPRGEEIIGILTHLTDTSQNNQFHDKYFSEIDFDVSKCLFIFSYNDEAKVNSILKDRMYRIQTKGYETKDKVVIAKNFLLPKIREQVNFKEGEIIIPDDVLQYIINGESFTKKESGVRNLKRCLEIIHTKLNLFRLVKSDQNIFSADLDIPVTFPITVTQKIVDTLIKSEEPMNQSLLAMYV